MDVQNLIKDYQKAKRLEDKHKATRRELGARLAAVFEHPEDGSKTHTIEGYKVTVKGVVNRSVDWGLYDSLFASNPGKHPPHIEKRELDKKGLVYYRENDPDFYRALAETITAKPGTPQITIKEIE